MKCKTGVGRFGMRSSPAVVGDNTQQRLGWFCHYRGRPTKAKILIVFLSCAAAFTAAAQDLWNTTYVGGKPTMLFGSTAYDLESFKVIGVVSGQPNNLSKGFVSEIDTIGQMTLLKIFEDSINVRNGLFWNTLIQDNKNEFCFIGFAYDSLPSLSFYVSTNNLDSVKMYKYYTPNTSAFQGYSLLQNETADFFVTGVRTNEQTNNADVVLIRIDLLGNRLWEKYYDQKKLDFAKSIIQLANGNLMLGAVRNDVNQTNEHANTWLLEVDTGGNVVRQWFDPSDSTYVAEGLRQTQDGGFIYGAQKKSYQTVNDVYKTSTIVKLDSNFNKQWIFDSDTLSPTGFTDIEILPDGSYIACGAKNYRYAWIVKLSASGQKIWSKEYVGITDWGSKNFLRDIDVLPDGGLVAVGESQLSGATPPQVGWFLKLDSNGCEVENCYLSLNPSPSERDLNSQIQVWPNPASDEVMVELPEEMMNAELKIFDVNGKQLHRQQATGAKITVDVSGFSKGLYLLTAEREGKVFRAKLMVE